MIGVPMGSTQGSGGGGGYGNSFLGTYLNLAKWAVPYAADENKKRLEDKYSLMKEYGLIKGKDAGTKTTGGGLSQLTNDSAKVFSSGPSAMPKWGQSSGATTHTPSAYAGDWNQPIDRTEKAPMPTQPYAGTAPGEFTTRMPTGVSTQAPQPTTAQPQATAQPDMSMAEGGQLPYRYNPLTGEFEENPDYKEEEVA
jgi:hypothetical protein